MKKKKSILSYILIPVGLSLITAIFVYIAYYAEPHLRYYDEELEEYTMKTIGGYLDFLLFLVWLFFVSRFWEWAEVYNDEYKKWLIKEVKEKLSSVSDKEIKKRLDKLSFSITPPCSDSYEFENDERSNLSRELKRRKKEQQTNYIMNNILLWIAIAAFFFLLGKNWI
ncbi:hypothetical protein AGMMS49965_13150 [Bacteroidia bacterium]|nr:hypothetical protein AGMMS49965_13150 [Bacteroidia bacterium]